MATWVDESEVGEYDVLAGDGEEDVLDGDELFLEGYDEEDDPEEAYGRRRRGARGTALERQRRLRRLRRQRIMAARRRPRARPPARRRPAPRAMRGLEGRAQIDDLHAVLESQARRFGATIALTTVAKQFEISFEDKVKGSALARTLLNGAPLVLLPGGRPDGGVGGFLGSPRAIGIGAVAAIAVTSELTSRIEAERVVQRVRITSELPQTVLVGFTRTLDAEAIDVNGRHIPEKDQEIVWSVEQGTTSVTVDPESGLLTAVAPGPAGIRAQLGEIFAIVSTEVLERT
jgi:hypothetical protein